MSPPPNWQIVGVVSPITPVRHLLADHEWIYRIVDGRGGVYALTSPTAAVVGTLVRHPRVARRPRPINGKVGDCPLSEGIA